MHVWGDKWFEKNGQDLDKALTYIFEYVKRLSGCVIILKEKWGTIRYEWIFPPGGSVRYGAYFKLPSMFDRPTRYGNVPRYLWYWNYENILYRYWVRFGKWVLTRAVKKACKKWPHLKTELTADLDIECLM